MPADPQATRHHPPTRPDHPAVALPVTAPDGTRRSRHATRDRAAAWLRNAMIALAVLAAAAAAVSWDAQYVLVKTVKHTPAIAALEAGIPDVGALGIALALHGKRAIRARTLNVACVGISLAMNALASAPGWRDLAIWVMPSAVYALASDTLIGSSAPGRSPAPATTTKPSPMTNPLRWPSSAACCCGCCGCCAWPWPRRPPSPGSAAGRWKSAPSPLAAKHPAPPSRQIIWMNEEHVATAAPPPGVPSNRASRPA
jgi:hypothetical protein